MLGEVKSDVKWWGRQIILNFHTHPFDPGEKVISDPEPLYSALYNAANEN